MKVSLTQKIYAGNFLLLAAIVGMVVILFRERSRMREIDFEVHDLQSVRNDICLLYTSPSPRDRG